MGALVGVTAGQSFQEEGKGTGQAGEGLSKAVVSAGHGSQPDPPGTLVREWPHRVHLTWEQGGLAFCTPESAGAGDRG